MDEIELVKQVTQRPRLTVVVMKSQNGLSDARKPICRGRNKTGKETEQKWNG